MNIANRAREDLPAERIEEEAHSRLSEVGYRSLTTVTCHPRRGDLFLRGHVPTYYEKQLAQESLRTLAKAIRIVNEIEVS